MLNDLAKSRAEKYVYDIGVSDNCDRRTIQMDKSAVGKYWDTVIARIAKDKKLPEDAVRKLLENNGFIVKNG